MPSVFENILARVYAALLDQTTAAGEVYRARVDAYAEEDAPAINIRRAPNSDESLGERGAKWLVYFDIDFHIGKPDDPGWEMAVDALHMEAHAILMADPQLAVIGRGLRCISTDPASDSADRVVGKLTARYQMQIFVRPGDLTRTIN